MHLTEPRLLATVIDMGKIKQAEEKRQRNEEYAKKFQVKKKKIGKRVPKFANWCRTLGHPSTCQCVYPPRAEIIPGGRK